jgi:hypothetical protein
MVKTGLSVEGGGDVHEILTFEKDAYVNLQRFNCASRIQG